MPDRPSATCIRIECPRCKPETKTKAQAEVCRKKILSSNAPASTGLTEKSWWEPDAPLRHRRPLVCAYALITKRLLFTFIKTVKQGNLSTCHPVPCPPSYHLQATPNEPMNRVITISWFAYPVARTRTGRKSVFREEIASPAPCSFRRERLLAFIMLIGFLIGCGMQTGSTTQNATSPRGTVDLSLPPTERAAQEAVAKLLNAYLEGVMDEAGLGIYAPGISFPVESSQFLDGNGTLIRWSFQGRPRGNSVPVTLYIDDQNTGQSQPKELRKKDVTLEVSRAERGFRIRLK